jgi:hypothetical protein
MPATKVVAQWDSPHRAKAIIEITQPVGPSIAGAEIVLPAAARVTEAPAFGSAQPWFQTIQDRQRGEQHLLLRGGYVLTVGSVLKDTVTVLCDGKTASDSQVELIVFSHGDFFVEQADFFESGAPHEGSTWRTDRIAFQKHAEIVFAGSADVRRANLLTVAVYIASGAESKAGFGLAFKGLQVMFDGVGPQAIIGIKKKQVVARAEPIAEVSGRGHAAVLGSYDAQAGEIGEHHRRRLQGAIIHDENFDMGIRQSPDTRNSLRQEFGLIEVGDDDRYFVFRCMQVTDLLTKPHVKGRMLESKRADIFFESNLFLVDFLHSAIARMGELGA